MTKPQPKAAQQPQREADAAIAAAAASRTNDSGIVFEERPAAPTPFVLAPERKNTMPASDRIMGAARIRVEAEANKLLHRPDHAVQADLAYAEKLQMGAMAALGPDVFPQGAGGELVPQGNAYVAPAPYIDTVKNPSLVTAEASRTRLDMANNAGVLSLALDICDTIQARDTTERMLAEQMALMHKVTMQAGHRASEYWQQAQGAIDRKFREECSIQAQRATNSMSRASAEYQNAMLTLQKVRTGGKQTITVTHIQNTQVNEGGKAVVTSGVGGALSHGGDK